jgi:hypothetical protein
VSARNAVFQLLTGSAAAQDFEVRFAVDGIWEGAGYQRGNDVVFNIKAVPMPVGDDRRADPGDWRRASSLRIYVDDSQLPDVSDHMAANAVFTETGGSTENLVNWKTWSMRRLRFAGCRSFDVSA